MRQYSLDDRFNEITTGIDNLYSYLHILKSYTKDKGVDNNEVAIIDTLMNNILEEINKMVLSL